MSSASSAPRGARRPPRGSKEHSISSQAPAVDGCTHGPGRSSTAEWSKRRHRRTDVRTRGRGQATAPPPVGRRAGPSAGHNRLGRQASEGPTVPRGSREIQVMGRDPRGRRTAGVRFRCLTARRPSRPRGACPPPHTGGQHDREAPHRQPAHYLKALAKRTGQTFTYPTNKPRRQPRDPAAQDRPPESRSSGGRAPRHAAERSAREPKRRPRPPERSRGLRLELSVVALDASRPGRC